MWVPKGTEMQDASAIELGLNPKSIEVVETQSCFGCLVGHVIFYND